MCVKFHQNQNFRVREVPLLVAQGFTQRYDIEYMD